MPGGRQRGMDHDIYPFAPLPARPPFSLPGGERIAFYVLLHLEYWELLPSEDAYRDPRFKNEFGNFFPEYRVWTYREYGARVGVFRILDILARPLTQHVAGYKSTGIMLWSPQVSGPIPLAPYLKEARMRQGGDDGECQLDDSRTRVHSLQL